MKVRRPLLLKAMLHAISSYESRTVSWTEFWQTDLAGSRALAPGLHTLRFDIRRYLTRIHPYSTDVIQESRT